MIIVANACMMKFLFKFIRPISSGINHFINLLNVTIKRMIFIVGLCQREKKRFTTIVIRQDVDTNNKSKYKNLK